VEPGTVRLTQVQRDRPDVQVCRVAGKWHAWIPDPADPKAGREVWGRTLRDLMDRLDAALGR
jgi:hypothetical protein